MTLNHADVGKEYVIEDVLTEDPEMRAFLFSLGCYGGEAVTVVSKKKSNLVMAVKDGRYSIDPGMAEIIMV